MTLIPRSLPSLPRTAAPQWPGVPNAAERPPRESALPMWLVTMPTVASDGACGMQLFAVRTGSAAQAIADATVHAGSTKAVLRRRGARICIEQAQATVWNGDGAW